jgi:nitroreductase
MTIKQSLEWRYATKQFDATKKVSDSDLEELLEALQLSPSSFGLQPWKFIVVTNPDTRAKLKAASWNQTQITDASHLIVLARQTDMTEAHVSAYISDIAKKRNSAEESLEGYKQMMNGFIKAMSLDKKSDWMSRQVYIALGVLLTTCAIKHIDACPMEGFDHNAYDDILNLKSKGLTSVVLCPVGYRSTKDHYDEEAKVRYPLSQLVITEK